MAPPEEPIERHLAGADPQNRCQDTASGCIFVDVDRMMSEIMAGMTNFYIPPKGLYFRLLSYSGTHVLCSRNSPDPQVFHHPQAEIYGDHWFQLLPGTGRYKGYYAIKSQYTGKVLFARNSLDPHVGHINGDGQYDDNWFKIEVGSGIHKTHFRLRNFASDTVLFSRTHAVPQVYNHPASAVHDDQYFSFLFEDMKIDRVEYQINWGKIVSSTPVVIANQTLINDSPVQQSMEFSVSETVTHTSTFDYTLGFTITAGISGKAGVPFVAEGQVKVDLSNSHQFKWGWATSTSHTYTAKLPANAPAQSTVRAVSSITRSNVEVPFTIYLKSVSNGLEVETHGICKAVTTWDLRHKLTTVGKTSQTHSAGRASNGGGTGCFGRLDLELGGKGGLNEVKRPRTGLMGNGMWGQGVGFSREC